MLESIATVAAPESLSIPPEPAVFEAAKGTRADGTAAVEVTRASIAVRFAPAEPLVVEKAAYGESNGNVVASSGAWVAADVNDAGLATDGTQLFGTMSFLVRAKEAPVAATRLVVAGAAWNGSGSIDGRRAIVQRLSRDTVSHHDARVSVTVEGDLEAGLIETIGRATAFVAGIDVEILRVERYAAGGSLVSVEHRRGYRRVGRGPHSPFTGVADEHRTRAWIAVIEAFPRLIEAGVPIDMIVDQISAHNQVSQIHVSAVLLLLSSLTAAHQRLHGGEVGPPAASRRAELEALDRHLNLGLQEEDFERYERVRIELLEAGFFHKPGYETGRPQRDIKFLRDIAHVTVLRLCGYAGPFYGAERFTVRQLTAAP